VVVAWAAAVDAAAAGAVVVAEGVVDAAAEQDLFESATVVEHPSAAAALGPAILGALVDFAGWVSSCAVEVGDLVPDARPSGRRPPWLA
jgi:hypothetical protein